MLAITLYKFAKRKNSTKQPANTDTHTDISGLMKTPSSIVDPVITVKDSPVGYNYAYISEFSRYYFINDIVYKMGEWEVYLSSDPLASFKSTLGGLSAYVVRSASNKNGYIKDNNYPLTGAHTKYTQSWSPFPISSSGYYYLTIASKSAGQYSIKLTQSEMDSLMSALMAYGNDPNNWQSTEQAIMNQTFNPIQYITNVFWSPISFTTHSGGVSLAIGNYDTGVAYSNITDKYITFSHSFTINAHPQAAVRGSYCNMSPYSEHRICAGGFGEVNVPSDLLTEATNTVDLEVCVDTRNGTATMVCKCNGIRFSRLSGSVGVQVPISQVSRDILGSGVSLANGAIKMLEGRFLEGIAAIVGGVESAFASSVSTTGTLGSLANLYDNIHLVSVYYTIADDDNTNSGRPYCSYVQINTLSGFLQCEKGVFQSADATASEISEVNSHMVAGFYYE